MSEAVAQLSRDEVQPLPQEFLRWQVALRRHTAEERGGHPHAGVAPLLTVRSADTALGVSTHSIICGLLPAPEKLEEKTASFRKVHEQAGRKGEKAIYRLGLEMLKSYYGSVGDFDPVSLTTMLEAGSPAAESLRKEPRCSLLFYVFNLGRSTEIESFRCLQLDCLAEVLESGPVYENVWWHNMLFHGRAENNVVVHFRHLQSFDTRWGGMKRVQGPRLNGENA